VEIGSKFRSQMTGGDNVSELDNFSKGVPMLVGVGDRVKEGIGVRCMEWIEQFNVSMILGKFIPLKVVRHSEDHVYLGHLKS